MDARGDGAVLPILHLNGYKIANPTVLARIPEDELRSMLEGFGHRVYFVSGDDPADVHRQMAAALDRSLDEIGEIQRAARSSRRPKQRPSWPMIVLRTPKGWTGPEKVDGKPVEDTWRSHQVPMADVRDIERAARFYGDRLSLAHLFTFRRPRLLRRRRDPDLSPSQGGARLATRIGPLLHRRRHPRHARGAGRDGRRLRRRAASDPHP